MDRQTVLDTIDAVLHARRSGDMAVLDRLLADGATFELGGDAGLLPGFQPALRGPARGAAEWLAQHVPMLSLERTSAVVEGRRAANLWQARVQLGPGEPVDLPLFDLWDFDEQGRVTRVLQFTDTARLAQGLSPAR